MTRDERNELASNCLTKALCEFMKANGDTEPVNDGGLWELYLRNFLDDMRKAKAKYDSEKG